MKLQVTREAVCLADDQLEPLELTREFGADATLEDLVREVVRTGFLHFSSTHHTLIGRSAEIPLVRIEHRWATQHAEYLVAPDTKLVAVIDHAGLHFRFVRPLTLPSASTDLDRRRPVWLALSDLFLDTDTALFLAGNARRLAASPYSLDELDTILREEVYPSCSFNLREATGEWAGFDPDWLEQRILCGGDPPRPRWRRGLRYLLLGWETPVRLPPEWAAWRAEVARCRADPGRREGPPPA